MKRIQVSKLKYIELVSQEMKRQTRYKEGMAVKPVPIYVNPRGFVEVSKLPNAKAVMMLALATVDNKYYYEPV